MVPRLPIAVMLLLVTGCKPSRESATRPGLDDAWALALAAPGGREPVDREIEALQIRVRRAPDADGWVQLGQAWVRKARHAGDPGLYLAADGTSALALALNPTHRGALGLRTLVLLNQHAFREARSLSLSILARAPEDLLALGALSDAELELGDIPAAIAAAQRMVDLKPNLLSYGRAAHLRWLTGDVAGAKSTYAAAIDAGRGARDREPLAWMVVQAALVFWHEGDLAGAEAGFDGALQLVPDHPPALVGKARCRLAQGDALTAIRLLEDAHARQPLVETAWLLGDARAAAGDAAGAEAVYGRLVRGGRLGDPFMLALFEATRGRALPEAVQLLELEHRTRPGIYVEDAYGWALYRVGRLADARAASDRAVARGTPDPRLLYHAGAIRLAQGERENGAALVRRALALNPSFDMTEAAEARALLESPIQKNRQRIPQAPVGPPSDLRQAPRHSTSAVQDAPADRRGWQVSRQNEEGPQAPGTQGSPSRANRPLAQRPAPQ
jgi:tetratricopeptide (TPR) repeat protein